MLRGGNTQIHVRVIDDLAQLSVAVLRQWERLPKPSPMQSPAWLCAWWNVYGREGRNKPHVLLVFRGRRLVGVAPFYLQRRWIGADSLRLLGDGEICSDHATVLAEPGAEDLVQDAVEEHLLAAFGKRWHTVYWQSLDDGNHMMQQLARQLSPRSPGRQVLERDGCWHASLPSSWPEYLGRLSKNHRKRCRRWQREYFDAGRARVVLCPAAEVQAAWQRLAELNEERRQQVGDRSCFSDALFHRFHLAILPQFIAEGKAELRQLYVDNQLVAAEYVLLQDQMMFCYQSGMKAAEHRDGYGNLSILALFRDAIDRGIRRIDFLRGDESYKQHWGTQRTACRDYRIAAATLPGHADCALQRALATARSLHQSAVDAFSSSAPNEAGVLVADGSRN